MPSLAGDSLPALNSHEMATFLYIALSILRAGWEETVVSVIVPVYNVAPYLSSCLNSVLPALSDEDEVILSLGASTDQSNELCRAFAAQNKKIKLVEQDGTGLSNARNCAIMAAHQTYVVCIDSDDYVDTAALSSLLTRMRAEGWTEDLIVNDYYRYDRKTGRTTPFFQIGEGRESQDMAFLSEMLAKRRCFWNVWRFLYRRQFLMERSITYREGYCSEDVDYTVQVLMAANSVRFVHAPYYYYTVGRGESLMDRPTWKRLRDTVEVLMDSVERLRLSTFVQAEAVCSQFQFEYLLNLALICEIPRESRANARALFQRTKTILNTVSDPAVRLGAVMLRLFGVRVAAYGMYCLKKLKRFFRNKGYRKAANG